MNGIQAPIDYKTVPPLPQAKTVSAVNNFVIATTQFLNKFSYLCERKLEDVHKNLSRLEITMNILEAKLSSIPGFEGASPVNATGNQQNQQNGNQNHEMDPSAAGNDLNLDNNDNSENNEPPAPATTSNPIKDDPRFSQYFKMLRLGIPVAQIKMKMKFDNVDPNLLDDPEKPSPAPGMGMKGLKEDENNSEDEEEEETEDNKPKNESINAPPPPTLDNLPLSSITSTTSLQQVPPPPPSPAQPKNESSSDED